MARFSWARSPAIHSAAQARVPVEAVRHVEDVLLVQVVRVQADVVIDVATTVGVAVRIRAPVVAPAAEPEPEVEGVGAPDKDFGCDCGWLTDLEAQAEGPRGPNLGGLRTACVDGHDCRGGRDEKNEAFHGRAY